MRSKRTWTLTLLAFLATLSVTTAVGGIAPAVQPSIDGGAPTVVTYQGYVAVDDVPYDGTGYFKFAVVDGAGTTSYWSHDGTSSAGEEPDTAIALEVENGQFYVLLGDTSVPNMTQPLDAAVFAGTERSLRLWFGTDGTTFELLSPDRRIASMPYALQADEAANADTVDGLNAEELLLPGDAMVLGSSEADPALIDAGYSFTGLTLETASWSLREPLPTRRGYLATAAVDGIVYAIGGVAQDTARLQTVEAYDPATDSWISRAPMPTARYGLAAAAVDGIIYAIGGGNQTYEVVNTVEAYDPATDSWTIKAPMPTARGRLAAAVVNGIIYAMGGEDDGGGQLQTVEAYDPASNSWTAKTPMPTGRSGLAVAEAGGILYAMGGFDSDGYSTNEAYDPATDSWSGKAPMPTGRSGLGAVEVGGLVYAIGGTFGDYLGANEVYDPGEDSWRMAPGMPRQRAGLAMTAVDGVLYSIGGYSSGVMLANNEAFKPALPLYVYRKD